MSILEKQIKLITRQLGGLGGAQRAVLGLCVLLLGLSVLMLAHWSMRDELVPLTSEPLTEAEFEEVARKLKIQGEKFEERQGMIFISPADRRRLLMWLFENNSGPKSVTMTFQDLMDRSSPFTSEKRTQWQQNVALQSELGETLRTSSKIRDAKVFISAANPSPKLGQPAAKRTATVQVAMALNHKLDQALVDCVADLVAGAVEGLDPRHVNVIDQETMRSYAARDPEDDYGSELYGAQRQKEADLQQRIESFLHYIPGVSAIVSLKLDDEDETSEAMELGTVVPMREMSEEEEQQNSAGAQEPGVSTNTSTGLAGGGGGNNRSRTRSEVEYMPERDRTRTTKVKRPGRILEAAASINIPRSYVVGIYKAQSGNSAAEPASAEMEDLIERETASIATAIKPILTAASAKEPTVQVNIFSDDAQQYIPRPETGEPQAAGSLLDLVKVHGGQLGLGSLAVLALLMVMRMARRPGDAGMQANLDSMPNSTSVGPYGDLMVDSGPVGKASAPDAFLIAQETDENSIRARQISQQVSEMIDDDPEGAAQLVRRWIEREP